jgi:hypothetical protein
MIFEITEKMDDKIKEWDKCKALKLLNSQMACH